MTARRDHGGAGWWKSPRPDLGGPRLGDWPGLPDLLHGCQRGQQQQDEAGEMGAGDVPRQDTGASTCVTPPPSRRSTVWRSLVSRHSRPSRSGRARIHWLPRSEAFPSRGGQRAWGRLTSAFHWHGTCLPHGVQSCPTPAGWELRVVQAEGCAGSGASRPQTCRPRQAGTTAEDVVAADHVGAEEKDAGGVRGVSPRDPCWEVRWTCAFNGLLESRMC